MLIKRILVSFIPALYRRLLTSTTSGDKKSLKCAIYSLTEFSLPIDRLPDNAQIFKLEKIDHRIHEPSDELVVSPSKIKTKPKSLSKRSHRSRGNLRKK
jgi:hypothetical protein